MSKNNNEDDVLFPILHISSIILTIGILVVLVSGWNYTGSTSFSSGGIDPKVFDPHFEKFEKSINAHFDKAIGAVNEKASLSLIKINSVLGESNKILQNTKIDSAAISDSVSNVDKKLLIAESKVMENINKLSNNLFSQNQKLLDENAAKYIGFLLDSKTKFEKVDLLLDSIIINNKETFDALNKQNNLYKDLLMTSIATKSIINLDAVTSLKKESTENQNYIANQIIRILNLFSLPSDDNLPGSLLVLDSGDSMNDLVFDDIINDIRSVLSVAIKLTPKRKLGFLSFRGEKIVQALPFGIQDSLSVGNINKNDLSPDRNEVNNWKNSISSSINSLSAINGKKRLIYLTCNPNNLKPIDVDFIIETQKNCVKHKIDVWVFHFLRNKDDSVSNDLSLISLGSGGQYFPVRLSKDFNKDLELAKVVKNNFMTFLFQSFSLNLVVEPKKLN